MNNLLEYDWYVVSCFLSVENRYPFMWLNESSHGAFVQITEERKPTDQAITFLDNVLTKVSDLNIYRSLVAAGLNVCEEIGMFNKYKLLFMSLTCMSWKISRIGLSFIPPVGLVIRTSWIIYLNVVFRSNICTRRVRLITFNI